MVHLQIQLATYCLPRMKFPKMLSHHIRSEDGNWNVCWNVGWSYTLGSAHAESWKLHCSLANGQDSLFLTQIFLSYESVGITNFYEVLTWITFNNGKILTQCNCLQTFVTTTLLVLDNFHAVLRTFSTSSGSIVSASRCQSEDGKAQRGGQVLKSKTRSQVHYAGRTYTSVVIAGEGCNYLGERFSWCSLSLVGAVFGRLGWRWWQHRRTYHVFSTCGASLPRTPSTSYCSLSFHLEEESSLASSFLSSLKLAAVSFACLRPSSNYTRLSLCLMSDFTLRQSALIYRFWIYFSLYLPVLHFLTVWS